MNGRVVTLLDLEQMISDIKEKLATAGVDMHPPLSSDTEVCFRVNHSTKHDAGMTTVTSITKYPRRITWELIDCDTLFTDVEITIE